MKINPSPKYIPIYKFSASKADERTITDKSDILNNLIDICLKKIGSPHGSIDALNISVSEIISNIEDHSDAKYGWINAQYYPNKKYLDICIVDQGITINGKYKKVDKGYENDREALKCALQGESAKPEKIRGSGLPTFTNMVTQGFKGEMVIISGEAIVYASAKETPLVRKLSVRWDGTIVAFRIPVNSQPIDYALYID
jgi:anti-sigma regulatory factor (Ser/Thr protein kinase)